MLTAPSIRYAAMQKVPAFLRQPTYQKTKSARLACRFGCFCLEIPASARALLLETSTDAATKYVEIVFPAKAGIQ